jgi:hypothetical protein
VDRVHVARLVVRACRACLSCCLAALRRNKLDELTDDVATLFAPMRGIKRLCGRLRACLPVALVRIYVTYIGVTSSNVGSWTQLPDTCPTPAPTQQSCLVLIRPIGCRWFRGVTFRVSAVSRPVPSPRRHSSAKTDALKQPSTVSLRDTASRCAADTAGPPRAQPAQAPRAALPGSMA